MLGACEDEASANERNADPPCFFGDEYAKDPERSYYLYFLRAIFRKKTTDIGCDGVKKYDKLIYSVSHK